MDQPSFSIIIPTYQRRDVVSEAVRALTKVAYGGRFEVIVVVDGSTDGTADALRKLECPFPLHVVEQDNHGLAHARNRGAADACGEILLFLDDDMMSEPDILEQHARSYAQGADAVVGDFPVHPDSPPGFLTEAIAEQKHWERDGIISSPFEVFGGHLSVRRSAYEEVGGFDEKFTDNGKYGNEDIEFGLRLLEHFQVRRNPEAISFQRCLVGPGEYMRRTADVADADLYFASKHPQLAAELFAHRGLGRTSPRLQLLSRIPGVPRVLGSIAVGAAKFGLRTPFRSSRKLTHLFNGAYLVKYWSAVRSRAAKHNGSGAIPRL